MAYLHNANRSLRLQLMLAEREVQRARPVAVTAVGPERLLMRVSMDHLDRKDGEYWPFVRLPGIWLALEEGRALVEGLERLVRGELPGFAFRSQLSAHFGLQVGAVEGNGQHPIELGLDLEGYLESYSGTSENEGENLALFRFGAPQAELVSFASAFRAELKELLERGSP